MRDSAAQRIPRYYLRLEAENKVKAFTKLPLARCREADSLPVQNFTKIFHSGSDSTVCEAYKPVPWYQSNLASSGMKA